MQIRANCKYDFEAIKALTYLTMYRKNDPKKSFTWTNIIFAVLFAILLLEMMLFGLETMLVLLAIVAVVCVLLNLFMYLQCPIIRYRSLANLRNACNEYTFTEDSLLVTTQSAEYDGKAEIAYALFVKAYETSSFLFLFQTNNQVLLVNKSTLTGGTIEEIRNKLCLYLNQKYIICKY